MAQDKASRGHWRAWLPKLQHLMQALLASPVPPLSDDLYLLNRYHFLNTEIARCQEPNWPGRLTWALRTGQGHASA